MTPKKFLKGKKALVVVLGIYGGGAATAKWLFKNGANVSVTDFRTESELSHIMKLFTPREKKNIRFILGGQNKQDFISHDIIVLGPGVPKESPYLAVALRAGKQIENDASLFFRFVENPVIAVTGTRGKTTVATWLASVLGQKYGTFISTGNNPEHAFLKELSGITDKTRPVVAEMSSWQLEYLPASKKAPRIAVITNIFPDHLNRYKDIKEYALAKANIFKDQSSTDFLILNDENEWTPFFLELKPQAQLFFFSKKPLPKSKNGVFIKDDVIIFRRGKEERKILKIKDFSEKMGEHNLRNFLAVALAVALFDQKLHITKRIMDTLPRIPFRQEIVFSKNGLIVVNDSASTSPDATIAALKRFKGAILITGGTDKILEFTELAKEIKTTLSPNTLILLNGSATKKLITELEKVKFFKNAKPLLFETLEECVVSARSALTEKRNTLVFSPGAASFEKFKNEFERGEKFTSMVTSLNLKGL